MNCLVTGAAGFIGSHLTEHLLRRGYSVLGIDCLLPSYSSATKMRNLEVAFRSRSFSFMPLDLREADLDAVVKGAEVICHLAALPGLPTTFETTELYHSCNVTATERLWQAVLRHDCVKRFVYASTSSVYGAYAAGDESLPLQPVSVYGETKAAAEQVCLHYAKASGLPLAILRYFSVYGPRQRPDMAYHRFIDAMLRGLAVSVHGDGAQLRSNTYVTDCVEATLAALESGGNEVYNVGGHDCVSVLDVIRILEALIGVQARMLFGSDRLGDQRVTHANTAKLGRLLRWSPLVRIEEGLQRQVAWQRHMMQ